MEFPDIDADELKRAGNRFLITRDYARAERVFREAIAADSNRPDVYVCLAKVLDRTDRFEEIVRLLEPVYLRFDSAQLLQCLADAHRVLAERGQMDHLDRAIRRYNEYHLRRRDPRTLFYLGHLLADYKEDLEEAYRAFHESWDLEPAGQPAYQAAIRMLQKLGRDDDVEAMKKLWRERSSERKKAKSSA